MPYETEIIPLLEWLPLALLHWLKVVGLLCALAVVGGFLVATLRRGPVFAAKNTFWAFVQGIRDLVLISPKRVFALAWLAVKESFRRKVLIVVAIFVVLLLLAGWYLDPGSTHPGRLYLSFVLSTTMYLMLLLALFLSSMSLPADVKNRTLHTIVTKPVRASEVVLGRILGFAIVASILLAAIGGVSYVFVVRGLAHTHELTVADLKALPGSEAGQSTAMTGKTSNVQSHRHAVYVAPDGTVRLETANEHTHKATAKKVDGKTVYTLGPQQGMLTARVPIYGEFKFRDRKGADSEEGINTGDEWQYRGYIEGNTLAAAIWTFEDITPERFPKGLPVEMTIEVYRTYKGDTSDPDDIPGIPGVLSLRNPKTGKQVRAKGFVGKEFTIDKQFIPRELEDADGRPVDVFKELVHDGKVEIWLECLARRYRSARAAPKN